MNEEKSFKAPKIHQTSSYNVLDNVLDIEEEKKKKNVPKNVTLPSNEQTLSSIVYKNTENVSDTFYIAIYIVIELLFSTSLH